MVFSADPAALIYSLPSMSLRPSGAELVMTDEASDAPVLPPVTAGPESAAPCTPLDCLESGSMN